jgi:hypothetical protein
LDEAILDGLAAVAMALVPHMTIPVVSTGTERSEVERRDLLSTISGLLSGEGLSAPRFALRSRRRGTVLRAPLGQLTMV